MLRAAFAVLALPLVLAAPAQADWAGSSFDSLAVREGQVVEKGDDGGRGNYVAIWSPSAGLTYLYLHMRAPARQRIGALVDAGERIGAVGCTGSCWGDHLHLEMRHGRGTTGRPLDPLPMLRRLAMRAR
jgi:murein DD-endopeptidase MepM/ murein hydrolase activator NlpD